MKTYPIIWKNRIWPDSIFPNNWVSFHANGSVALYPMFAENRRRERREETLIRLEKEGFIIKDIIDYTIAENEEIYLDKSLHFQLWYNQLYL